MQTNAASIREEARAAAPKLEVSAISKSFADGPIHVKAIDDISLSIRTGEFVCLVGSSGCGKTSLLRMIAGLDFPDSGSIRIDGGEIKKPGADRTYMFQEGALFPWLSALQNVLFGVRLKPGMSKASALATARSYLDLVGLSEFADHKIHQLSGGMKQRVSLARALAPEPQMLLMDEPFSALDAMTREQLYHDLQDIWRRTGKTILLVTHNVRESVCLGDRVLLCTPRPGRIAEHFNIELPRNRDINDPKVTAIASEVVKALKTRLRGDAL